MIPGPGRAAAPLGGEEPCVTTPVLQVFIIRVVNMNDSSVVSINKCIQEPMALTARAPVSVRIKATATQ